MSGSSRTANTSCDYAGLSGLGDWRSSLLAGREEVDVGEWFASLRRSVGELGMCFLLVTGRIEVAAAVSSSC